MRKHTRIAERVADAFLDREPIAWSAALDSAATSEERATIEQFRALDSLRARRGSVETAATRNGPREWIIWLAALQLTVMALAVVLFGVLFDVLTVLPPSRVVLVLAFVVATAVLSAAETPTPAVRALLAAFVICAVAFMRPVLAQIVSALSGIPWPARLVGMTSRVYPESFLPALLWVFAIHFPRSTRLTRFDRLARRVVSALWALGVLLFLVNGLRGSGVSWLAPLIRDHSSNAFWFLVSMPTLAAIGVIAWRTRGAEETERRRVLRCAAALTLGTAPFLLLALARLLWPPLNRTLLDMAAADRHLIDGIVLGGLTILPIAVAVSVITDRALDVGVVIQRTTQYALTRRALGVLTVLPLALLAVLLYRQRDLRVADIVAGSRGQLLLAWTAVAALLLAARSRIVAAIDRTFGRQLVDHHAEFGAVLDRVRNARGFREATFLVCRELERVAEAALVSIVRIDRPAPEAVAGAPLAWRSGSALECLAQQVEHCLDVSPVSPLFAMLPREDREWLARPGVHAIAAVRRRDGRLLGVVAVGARRGGMPLSRDDRSLIGSVATLLAVAWPEPRDDGGSEVAFECPACHRIFPTASAACACGRTPQPASLPAVLNDKFALVRRMGRGGMGVVYLADDLQLGRQVAVKTLPAASADAISELRSEARAMAGLRHHGLAMLYGIEVWRDTPALIVEYCPGGTLADKLAGGRLNIDEAIDLGSSVLDALEYMHARGLAHRDVKPSNIAFGADGRVKLLDFGLSSAPPSALDRLDPEDRSPETSGIAGTPLYLPPEAFRGQDLPLQRDLWAAALVLFEAVTGRHPFSAAGGSTLPVSFQLRDDAMRAVPPALDAFLRCALNPNPDARYRSAAEFRTAFESASRRWRADRERDY